tara:strand:- start:1906 stop:3432 length:1527 start_codon:yes stop_codon:yes gene_type:complete
MRITIIGRDEFRPDTAKARIVLQIDNWDDFNFVTMFKVWVFDSSGVGHDLGHVKIGFVGQKKHEPTHSSLKRRIQRLPDKYFSVGTSNEYYSTLLELSQKDRDSVLVALNDIAFNESHLNLASDEEVFSTSLLRDVSLSEIKGQFVRLLQGETLLSNFEFIYRRPEESELSQIKMDFEVVARSEPSTNIHAIIGRNGSGKTTILNDIIRSVNDKEDLDPRLYEQDVFEDEQPIKADYFSTLISVSFSAFDHFDPPDDQSDPSKGTCYYYVGLKDPADLGRLRSHEALHEDFLSALEDCIRQDDRRVAWVNSIRALESDKNFNDMELTDLVDLKGEERRDRALYLLENMSAGHTVVLLITTRLVSRVAEKSLVLIDEPESHLHPPLLSAFVRALSELLTKRNGVAIIATHSPVVLQEVPKSCVWKLMRSGIAGSQVRPSLETFGENVGVLTRDVFGLEVSSSGFHKLLQQFVDGGANYEDVLDRLNGQLGQEGQALLSLMINERDRDAL